ncbi:extracellular solute-binding protein [Microbacterium gorillae]|uniref:extracellular solute-binding protein n=1 Tax=Microbacterium gorillae TaxID=1231063 RepID=UPI00058B6826|nr:extracellular solute-binding protein [Microbacterium gorillae]
MLAVVGVLALAGCSPSGSSNGEHSLDFVYFEGGQGSEDFSEAQRATLWAPMIAKGVQIDRQAGDCGLSRLAQQVEANNVTPSIWHFCSIGEMEQAAEQGLLEKIDTDVVPVDLLQDAAVNEYGIGFGTWQIGLAYDAEAVGKEMTSIADVYDVKGYPGKRCIQNAPPQYNGALEAAMLSLGKSADDIYPIDFKAAYGELDRIRDDILLYSSSAEGSQNVLTGQCDMVLTSAANARRLIAAEPARDLRFVQEDGVLAMSALGIPKHAPNVWGANQYLKAILEDREGQKGLLEKTGNVSFMLKDPIEIPDSMKQWQQSLRGEGWIQMAEGWYQKNFDPILAQWNEWVVG